ncbi:MAG: hypothetical protein ACREL1_06575 [bacterium]
MTRQILLFKLGGLGLILSGLIFWENPLMAFRLHHLEFMGRLFFLYGFPWLMGFWLLALPKDLSILESGTVSWLSGGMVFLGLPWFLVWGFLWSRLVSLAGSHSPLDWRGLTLAQGLGIGLALIGVLSGCLARNGAARVIWFLRTLAWLIIDESLLNMVLQPGLWFLVFSALGGGLMMTGTWAAKPASIGRMNHGV